MGLMLWYEALIPSVAGALLVRLDAVFLGPYWSWLQLIPDLAEQSESEAYQKRRRALARRVAIPGAMGFVLVTTLPSVYSAVDAALIGLLTAALLLWPLVFSHPWQEVRRPRVRVAVLYSLFLLVFVSAAFLGGLVGEAARDTGSVPGYLRDQAFSFLVATVVILFGTDAFGRRSESLRKSRDAELDA